MAQIRIGQTKKQVRSQIIECANTLRKYQEKTYNHIGMLVEESDVYTEVLIGKYSAGDNSTFLLFSDNAADFHYDSEATLLASFRFYHFPADTKKPERTPSELADELWEEFVDAMEMVDVEVIFKD